MKIEIIIADDHKVMRQGLKSMLSNQSDIEIVAEAENGREAVELCEKHNPDVVVLDVGMPDLNGLDATHRIHNAQPDIKILAFSMHPDQKYVMEMLKAGASGYVLKTCAFEELSKAIRIVHSGKMYLDPSITTTVIKDYINLSKTNRADASTILSGREREVLQLIAEGKSSKEIARRLNVTKNTIVTHRQKIMNKLGLRSIAELTKYAIREGITPLEA